MKSISLLFCMAVSIWSIAQSTPSSKSLTRDLEKDLRELLPAGLVTMDIRDDLDHSDRVKELQGKFKKGMDANKDWWDSNPDSLKLFNAKFGYNPHLGISQEEYREIKENAMKLYKSTGKEQVRIIRNDSLITFKAQKRLSILDSVQLNFQNNSVLIAGYSMQKADTIYFKTDKNPYRTPVRGYRWKYMSKSGNNSLIPDSNTNLVYFELIIALAEKTGETIVEITRNEIKNGRHLHYYKYPLFFK